MKKQAELLASLPQSHDPSEIILIFWFAAEKTIIIMLLKQLSRIFSGFFDE